MTIAYSYIRFSSEKQLQGDSLRRQTELSDAYVKAHALTLDTSLTLKDLGVSAFKKANAESGALRLFLDAIKSGRVAPGSMLLVESLDRISRATVMEALEIFTSIINSGITIVTLSDSQVYSKDSIKDNWAQLIISISIMARAHEESLVKSQRIAAAWKNRKTKIAEKKLTGRCPSWLKLSADQKKFVFVPEKVKIVKRVLKMSKDGQGIDSISKVLNNNKIPSLTNHPHWSNTSVQRLLETPALYGEAHFKGLEPIPNYYPSLISKDEFLKLKEQRSSRKHGGGSRRNDQITNLFSGLCVCGYCGEKMWVSGYTGPKGHHKYYVCGSAKTGRGCTSIQWPIADFESMVLKWITELDVNEIIGESPSKTRLMTLIGERESINATLTDIKRRIQNLTNAIAEGAAPQSIILSIAQLETEALGLNRKLKEVSDSITEEENSDSVLIEQQKSIGQLTSLLSQKSGLELFGIRLRLQEQLRKIVKEVRVKPGGHFNNIGRDIDFKRYRYAELVFRMKDVVRVISLNKTFEKE